MKHLRLFFRSCADLVRLYWHVLWRRPRASALLCIASPASVGGTEFQVNKFAERLKISGGMPLVLILGAVRKKNNLFLERLRKEKIPYLFLGNLRKSTAHALKSFKATHCQFFNPKSLKLAPMAKKGGLKVIYTETGLPSLDPWWHPVTPHLSSIDLIIAVSGASLTRFQSQFRYEGPSVVVYSLIDPPPLDLERKRLEDDRLRIVYFGRMDRQKGIGLLLEAFEELLRDTPNVHLTFIGEGSAREGLERIVSERKFEKDVAFLDFKEKGALFEEIVNYDLFCLPSFTEGAPCAILEAMAIGLPVVATEVGGIPEIVEDGVSAILVPPHNKEALLRALKQLAKDPDLRRIIGCNALEKYKEICAKQNDLAKLY